MAANLGREMSVENLKQSADIENTHGLQRSPDTVASYTKLATCNAADVGYSNLWFTSHDDTYTEIIVDNNTQLTTSNIAENYLTLLADEQQSKSDHNSGYLELVDGAYCDILDDAGGGDVTNRAIASHQNVLSAAEQVNRLLSTRHSSNVNVLFHNTGSEQIAFDNDNSAGTTVYDNNADIITYDNNVEMQIHIHPTSELSDLITTADVYDQPDETMMYSEVNESTSSGNVSQQTTSVYIELDGPMARNIENAAVENTAEPSNFSFTHTNSKIVVLIISALLVGCVIYYLVWTLSWSLPALSLKSRQAFTVFRHDPITSPGEVDFTDVALNDGQVFDTSRFSPSRNGYFWLAVSAVGFAGHSMTLAILYTQTEETNVAQVTLNVHNAAHSWCTSFVDISYINKSDEVFVTSKHPMNVSSDVSASAQNYLYSFVGFQLDNIMKHPIFAVESDFGAGFLTMTTFQNGTHASTAESVTSAIISRISESIKFFSDICVQSRNNIIPQKAGWYLISVSIHCRINDKSSNADSEFAQNKVMRYKCLGTIEGFYSTNFTAWSDTRLQLLPKAFASFRTPERHQKLEADLVASSSALIFLQPGDVLHPYGGTEPSTTSIELFSVRALLYEPAHSYKAAWSVSCVDSSRSSTGGTDKSISCENKAVDNNFFENYAPYSPHTENVAYNPDSMAVQLDINGIYYIAFAASLGIRKYTTCSVWQHIQENAKNVLDFTFPSTTSDSDVYTLTSVQRSRLLLVRESASLTCKLNSTKAQFDECLTNIHPTFHGFLLYPV